MHLAAILVGTFFVFLPEIHYLLLYDDYEQLIANPRLRAWSYVPGYFTMHLWANSPVLPPLYYRPLFLLWFRFVYAVLGVPSPIWHLSSIIAHLAATACVYLLIYRLTDDAKGAALGAALFGIHPIHAETVAWVSSSGDLLLTIFVVLCVFFYVGKKGPISPLSVLFATLAMFTKETGVIAPVLILSYEWIRSNLKEAAANLPPYAFTALLYFAFRIKALGNPVTGAKPGLSVGQMVLTWPSLLAIYARHLIWPVHLSLSYDVPLETAVWPLLLLVVVLAGLVWMLRGSTANVRFGAIWFGLTLLPALLIRYINWDNYTHDRYLYLPSVGLALIAAEWLSRVRFTLPRSVAACALALILCWGTRLNMSIWHDGVSLFTRAVETAPRNMINKNNLAEAYLTAHRPADAFPILQQLLAQYPESTLANRNMARYYWQIGNQEEANRYYALSKQ